MAHRQESAPSPPYSPTAQDGAASPTHKLSSFPEGLKPTDFIHISRKDSVQGAYIIDPGLMLPASLMSPCPDHGDRKNVFITSEKGDVNVDLFVLPSSNLEQNKISMTFHSRIMSARIPVVRRGIYLVHCAGAYLPSPSFSMTPGCRTSCALVDPWL